MSSLNIALWFGASILGVAGLAAFGYIITNWTELSNEAKIIFFSIAFLLIWGSILSFLLVSNTFPFVPYTPEDPRDLTRKPIDSWLTPEFDYSPYLTDPAVEPMREIQELYP